jgi:hypothetical protein
MCQGQNLLCFKIGVYQTVWPPLHSKLERSSFGFTFSTNKEYFHFEQRDAIKGGLTLCQG